MNTAERDERIADALGFAPPAPKTPGFADRLLLGDWRLALREMLDAGWELSDRPGPGKVITVSLRGRLNRTLLVEFDDRRPVRVTANAEAAA